MSRAAVVAGESGGGLISGGGRDDAAGASARVAACRADLLLVDEPTARTSTGEDRQARVAPTRWCELARGKTLIAATHDPVRAARMCRVVRLDAPAQA